MALLWIIYHIGIICGICYTLYILARDLYQHKLHLVTIEHDFYDNLGLSLLWPIQLCIWIWNNRKQFSKQLSYAK